MQLREEHERDLVKGCREGLGVEMKEKKLEYVKEERIKCGWRQLRFFANARTIKFEGHGFKGFILTYPQPSISLFPSASGRECSNILDIPNFLSISFPW